MDHFPLPKDKQHIRVPNATFEEYSHGDGGFLAYPNDKLWSQEELLGERSFGGRSPTSVQAFFQTWLYFGCVIEVLKITGVESTKDDFLDTDKQFVTTKNLPSKIRQWKRNVKRAKESKQKEKLGRWVIDIEAILGVLAKFINYYSGAPGARSGSEVAKSGGKNWPVSEEITMSIIALGFTLRQALINFNGVVRAVNLWGPSHLLETCMLQAGWCPMDVRRSLTDIGIDGHYYIAASRNPQGLQYHARCTAEVCSASSINEDTYVTKHTDECWSTEYCTDKHVLVDIDCVVEILKDGGIPLVSWDATENQLNVKAYNPSKGLQLNYITISHVWSDGMGNPEMNSLPSCQLSRLQRLVDNLGPKVDSLDKPLHFWMDTLCVPVKPEHRVFRSLSIRKMKEIYNLSAATLVVETALTKLSSTASEYDTSLCLYFSSWNHRLWTFHEGMRAKKLMLQFSDKAVSYRDDLTFHAEAQRSCSQGHCVTFPNLACSSVMGEFVVLYDFLTEGLFPEVFHALAPMVGAIQHRTTSKLADQTICAMNILGEDPDEILKVDPNLTGRDLEEARMEIFLTFLGKVPYDIIFNICPRMQKDGFRWAPRSFLNIPKNGLLRDVEGEPGVITVGQGLTCKSAGFLLDSASRSGPFPPKLAATICQEDGKPLKVIIATMKDKYEPRELHWIPSCRYAVLMKNSFYSIPSSTYDNFPKDVVQMNDFLVQNSEKHASMDQHRRDAILGSVQEIRYAQQGEIEYIRLRHECLASVFLSNAADLHGSSDADSWESVVDENSEDTPPDTASPMKRVDGAEDKGEESVTAAAWEVGVDWESAVPCKLLADEAKWILQ